MTLPKDVDYLNKEEFENLLKYLETQPYYVNGKMIPTYAIHKGVIIRVHRKKAI